MVPIGPEFYPRIVLAVTATLAVLMVVGDMLAHRKPGAPRPVAGTGQKHRPNYALVALQFAVFGAYVLALPWLGFRVATLLYVAVAAALLAQPRDAKTWLQVLALALLTTLVTYFVFERYLTVLLPRGKWTGF